MSRGQRTDIFGGVGIGVMTSICKGNWNAELTTGQRASEHNFQPFPGGQKNPLQVAMESTSMQVVLGPDAGFAIGFTKANRTVGKRVQTWTWSSACLSPVSTFPTTSSKNLPLQSNATSYVPLSPFPSKQPVSMRWLKNCVSLLSGVCQVRMGWDVR